ncbi:MAG: helix-turn-helix transcriptional regulator [Actinomycetota bacterium]|nr:helix-turn-helix transcriptional regulator [Actinomycetota bacterium]
MDADALRLEVIAELRKAIGFASWCWPLMDPGAVLPTTALCDFEFTDRLPRLLVLEERADEVNTKKQILRAPAQTGILSAVTQGDLCRSARWREVYEPAGIGDELRLGMGDENGPWAVLDLWRASDDRPFQQDDARLLAETRRALTAAMRRSAVRPPDREPGPPLSPAVVVVDEHFEIYAQTATVQPWLDLFLPRDLPYLSRCPGFVWQLTARVLSLGEHARDASARIRLRAADGRWVVAEGQRLQGTAVPSVAVTMRPAAPSEIFDLVCRGHGLTARETEFARLIVQGLDTAAVARALWVSEYTVNDHLKSIFSKMGVRSRLELAAAIA